MENSGVYSIADHPTSGVCLASYELNPAGEELFIKVQRPKGRIAVSYTGCAPNPATRTASPG